jgi:hypothetical protein
VGDGSLCAIGCQTADKQNTGNDQSDGLVQFRCAFHSQKVKSGKQQGGKDAGFREDEQP